MLSAEDIAAVKVAVETCNNPELKREILCVLGSDFDSEKTRYEDRNKKIWDKIIERKTIIILKDLGLPARLHEKVTGFVLLVGARMLNWAEYHEMALGFSRDYSMNFLSCPFFTSKGIVDNKKAAEELRNDKNLTIKQKYKLACLYFTDNISDLYRQMENEDKAEFYDAQNPARIMQPRWVKFWSYYLTDDIDKLRKDKNLSLYRLETAVESGSKVAVEYCLEKTNLSRKKDAVIDAAVEAVINWARSVTRDVWVVFYGSRHGYKRIGTWVPSDYYVNIFSSLLAKMRDDQKVDFFKKDLEDVASREALPYDEMSSTVLMCFLKWPYQDYFMNTAQLIWEFLPEMEYVYVLLKMCDMIETKCGTLEYGEDRSYDYRGLLKKFWRQSPERHKRYMFITKERRCNPTFRSIDTITVEAANCVELLFKLLTLGKFTQEDRENINLILASADDKERENIKCSGQWEYNCYELIKEEKWELLDQFVLNWFSNEEEAEIFKRKLSMNYRICIDFVKKNRSTAESYIRWLALSETEINKLKKEMIYSEYGSHVCYELISDTRDVKESNEFCEWFFLSEEEVSKFKKLHIFPSMGEDYCSRLAREDNIEVADKFIKWCFSSEKEIKEKKRAVAYVNGGFVCEKLISDYSKERLYDEKGKFTRKCYKFKGGKWEQVEKFLTWCFSSEKEIADFKKIVLIGMQSMKIHLNLIKCNRWGEAETYFAWLGLSDEKIKKLKKDAFFSDSETHMMFSQLLYRHEIEKYKYVDYGDNRQEAIELLLRWHLTDKEAVLKFNDEFRCEYIRNVRKHDIEIFDLMIEQLLNDLDEEKREIKRKSESCFTYKKICNVEEKMD